MRVGWFSTGCGPCNGPYPAGSDGRPPRAVCGIICKTRDFGQRARVAAERCQRPATLAPARYPSPSKIDRRHAMTSELRDVTGFRGENIVELCLTDYKTFPEPLFRPAHLGEKWPAIDYPFSVVARSSG